MNALPGCFLVMAAAASLGSAASAQTVSMGGSLGSRALLVIDGKPKSVAVGGTVDGVRLISVNGNDAVVDVKGHRITLQLGGSPADLSAGPSEGSGGQIVLTAESGGHFYTAATINGRSVRFVVDTGATFVTMSQARSRADRPRLQETANAAPRRRPTARWRPIASSSRRFASATCRSTTSLPLSCRRR